MIEQGLNLTPRTIDELSNFLRELPSKICILVGAGISIDSGIPAAAILMQAVFKQLPLEEFYRNELCAAMSDDWDRRTHDYDYLRFEQVMSALELSIDPQLSLLSEFASYRVPNKDHYCLAHLIGLGHYVVTTNFDELIEQACDKLHVGVRVVVTEEEFRELERNGNHGSSGVLLKVHGTASTQGGRTRPAATFEDVTGETVVSAHKWRFVSNLMAAHDVVVLGYSGSDDFDVMPSLLCAQSSRRILWIQHGERPEDFPWRLKRSIGRQYLSMALNEDTQRAAEDCIFAVAKTDMVLELLCAGLWKSVGASNAGASAGGQLLRRIFSLFTAENKPQQYFLCGLLFCHCGDLPMANACFRKAFEEGAVRGSLWSAHLAAVDAVAWADRWDLGEARRSAEICISYFKGKKSIPHRTATLIVRAAVCGGYEETALQLAKKARFPWKESRRAFNEWVQLAVPAQRLFDYISKAEGICESLCAERAEALEPYAAYVERLRNSPIAKTRHPLAPVHRQLHGEADFIQVYFPCEFGFRRLEDHKDHDHFAGALYRACEIFERCCAHSRLAIALFVRAQCSLAGGWLDDAYRFSVESRLLFAKIGNTEGLRSADHLIAVSTVPAHALGRRDELEAVDAALERSREIMLRPI